MITNILNKNMARIIAYLAISPGSRYTRSEIKEKTLLNNVPLDEALAKLLIFRIIKHEKQGYSLKLEFERTKKIFDMIKEEYNKLHLSYPIFVILLEAIDKMSKLKPVSEIILFGSYAKLIHTDKSDIDLAVILHKKSDDKIKKKAVSIAQSIGKKEGKTIELHFFTEKEIKENVSDPLIKDILKNGKSLL